MNINRLADRLSDGNSDDATLLPPPDRGMLIGERPKGGKGSLAFVDYLENAAGEVRRRAAQTIVSAQAGHIGGEFSMVELLVALYLAEMNLTPAQVTEGDVDRDRFVLSKGHGANILYTVLAAAGYIPEESLRTFLQFDSMLNGHPAQTKIKAVEASTGPLGHGLPVAVGMALSGKLAGSARRCYVVLGDGELQEGSNWEALMIAAHHRLDNLVAIVDRNGLQQGAAVEATSDLEPLKAKMEAFNWNVIEINGHSFTEILEAFAGARIQSGRPTMIIANTEKGYPISFMRNNVSWHHKVPNEEQLTQILAELSNN